MRSNMQTNHGRRTESADLDHTGPRIQRTGEPLCFKVGDNYLSSQMVVYGVAAVPFTKFTAFLRKFS